MTLKTDKERAPACKSILEAIGMIANRKLALTWLVLTSGLMAHAVPSPFRAVPPTRPAVAVDQAETIRVRVSQIHASEFSLSGNDLVFDTHSSQGYHSYKLKEFTSAGAKEWIVTDRDTNAAFTMNPVFQMSGTNLRLNLKPVPDALTISYRSRHSTDIVAKLEIETYLRGVLPAEMPASWPMEALKAQAIAARTFALYRRAHQIHEGFDLDSDVMDQMFLNPTADPLTKMADRAIRETRGLILEDRKHRAFAAYFHADCGGHTEEARNVWGSGEATGTAIDAGCPLNPKANWTLRLSLKDIAQKLDRSIRDLSPGSRSPSGRLAELRLAMNDGTSSSISGNEFRNLIGFDQLKSTQFTMVREGDVFVFKGRGYGHGVGLCQWGARQMAKTGHSFKEILAHYYPKATLDRYPDLNDEESHGAHDKQAAQFHNGSPPRL